MVNQPVPTYEEFAEKIRIRLALATADMNYGRTVHYAQVTMIGCIEDLAVLARHKPITCALCTRQPTHLLCTVDRSYSWADCPEIDSLWNRYADPVVLRDGRGVAWSPVHEEMDGVVEQGLTVRDGPENP